MKNHDAIIKLLKAGFLLQHKNMDEDEWIFWHDDNIYKHCEKDNFLLNLGFGDPENWEIKEKFYSGAEAIGKAFGGCLMTRTKHDSYIYMDSEDHLWEMQIVLDNMVSREYVLNKNDYYAEDWAVYNPEEGENETSSS